MKILNGAGILLAFVTTLVCAPILWVETSCVAPAAADARAPYAGLEKDKGYRRPQGETFLIYPEWYVIDAYGDLAAVARARSESSFDYGTAISGFWSGLCAANEAASRSGAIAIERKATNYLVGYVFTAEMAVTGIWERTIGAAAVWTRGPVRTSEDEVSLKDLSDYAEFLKKTPGGAYPFAQARDRFWRETPTSGDAWIRKWDRRAAIVVGYTLRSAYTHPAGYLGSLAPEDRKIESIVDRLDTGDLAAEPRIAKIRDLPDGAVLIETPRGADFSDIVRKLGARGRKFIEVGGARRLLTTALVPPDKAIDFGGAKLLFSMPFQPKPGWRRVGLDTDAGAMAAQVGLVEGQGGIFERAYD